MKNKIGEILLAELFLIAVFVFLAFSVQGKAKDAFVVEEKAVIGAPEEPAEPAPPAYEQPPAPPQQAKEPAEPVKEKVVKQPEKEPMEEDETVSMNTVQPAFQVPVRRKDAPEPEIPVEKPGPEPAEAEEVMPKETEKNDTWILLVISGLFCVCGMIRILQRLRIRCGKL